MTVEELHKLTGSLIANKHGLAEVAIDFATFSENENGTILTVETASVRSVPAADDSGPIGRSYPFLVFTGA